MNYCPTTTLLFFSVLLQSNLYGIAWILPPSIRLSNAYVQRKNSANGGTNWNAFLRQQSHINQRKSTFTTTQRYTSVEFISFESISSNHEEVGQEIANSVQRMLDTEWMPQDIHEKMAQRVKYSYIKCRTSSETTDIMTIMTTVADDLTAHWQDYDKDAFVNAWDVANYVSDYLTTKAGGESCGCTSKIY